MTIVCNGGCVRSPEDLSPPLPSSPHFRQVSTDVNLSGRDLFSLPEHLRHSLSLTILDLSHNLLGQSETSCDLSGLDHVARLNLAGNELRTFPTSLTSVTSLEVLSLTGNELESLPAEIVHLTRLRRLHADFNHLTSLPPDWTPLQQLTCLTLASNKLQAIPPSVSELPSLRILRLQRNRISSMGALTNDALTKIQELSLSGNCLGGVVDLSQLVHLTALDLSHNAIEQLEVTSLVRLTILDCSHNNLNGLHVHGGNIRLLRASNNCLKTVSCDHSPSALEVFDISHNFLSELPAWLVESKQLKELSAAQNQITSLHSGLFSSGMVALEIVLLNHNLLEKFPILSSECYAKTLCLQSNRLEELPHNFFVCLSRLELVNLSYNQLQSLPLSTNCCHLKVMLLSGNRLSEVNLGDLNSCKNLEMLHLASNGIRKLPEQFLKDLPSLKELSLAGNHLQLIPDQLTSLEHLQKLYLHSNKITSLPSLTRANGLKVLDLACNHLRQLELAAIVPQHLSYLDLSANCDLHIDPKDFQHLCCQRSVAVVDVNCAGRTAPSRVHSQKEKDEPGPWLLGFTESQEGCTRLYIELEKDDITGRQEALVALMEVSDVVQVAQLRAALPDLLKVERECEETAPHYLRNTLLSGIRFLRARGHTRDPGITVCHLSSSPGGPVTLRLASIGRPASCILGRVGNIIVLAHREDSNACSMEEWNDAMQAAQVCKLNQFNSSSSSSLFPPKGTWGSIPDPEVRELVLSSQDRFLVFGDSSFVRTLSAEEVCKQVQSTTSPVDAAKRLAEMYTALSSGKRECVAVVMLRSSHGSGEEEVEKYRCWEYMLEQNHKLLFTKELETIHKSILRNGGQRLRIGDPSSWYSAALAKYKCPLPSHRGRYYCYGTKSE